MVATDNYRGARQVGDGVSTTIEEARERDMAALELLPQALRQLLNELNIALSAVTVLAFYRDICRQASSNYEAEVYTSRKLVAIEDEELHRFAAEYRSRHRQEHPHTAADASVLRYGSTDRVAKRRAKLLRLPA